MPAVGRADRVRRARVARRRGEGVVAALAVRGADGVDRGEVDDVEAHLCDRRQPAGGGPQRAGPPGAGARVVRRALRAGEHLVPRAGQRQLTLHEQRVVRRGRDHLTQRTGVKCADDGGGQPGGEPGRRCAVRVPQPGDGRVQGGARLVRQPVACCGPREQLDAFGEHELDVDAGLDLDRRVVRPGAVRVRPAFDPEGPGAGGIRNEVGAVGVQALVDHAHPDRRVHAAVGGEQHRRRGDGVVPLAEHRRGDLDGLAHHGLGRPAAGLEDRLHVDHRDATDRRGRPVPQRGYGCRRARAGRRRLGFRRGRRLRPGRRPARPAVGSTRGAGRPSSRRARAASWGVGRRGAAIRRWAHVSNLPSAAGSDTSAGPLSHVPRPARAARRPAHVRAAA